jgi:hypothetical protein
MPSYSPRLVISVHGIRTKAEWQKPLSKILKQNEILHTPYNFGYYNVFRFLFHQQNERMVDKFYEFYSGIIQNLGYGIDLNDNKKRPSIIAHSFGSYIVGYCMQKYSDVKFDKVIICGSILPQNFEWATLFMRDQINLILNEYGLKDKWANITGKYVKNTGNSGTKGFHIASTQLIEEQFDFFKHSDYFRGQHVQAHWLPFLQRMPNQLFVRHGHDFEDRNEFSLTLDITGTVIDEKCYGHLQGYNEVVIPRGLSLRWISINPDIYTFIFDRTTSDVKGYINAMPVDDEIFEKIKTGEVVDNEITEENIIPFIQNQKLKVYLMSIAIAPDARKVNEGLIYLAFEKLMNGYINKLIHYYSTQNIRVTQFLAVGWTTEGRKLCNLLGMTEIGIDKFGNNIYYLDLEKESLLKGGRLLESVKKLIITYNKNIAT